MYYQMKARSQCMMTSANKHPNIMPLNLEGLVQEQHTKPHTKNPTLMMHKETKERLQEATTIKIIIKINTNTIMVHRQVSTRNTKIIIINSSIQALEIVMIFTQIIQLAVGVLVLGITTHMGMGINGSLMITMNACIDSMNKSFIDNNLNISTNRKKSSDMNSNIKDMRKKRHKKL